MSMPAGPFPPMAKRTARLAEVSEMNGASCARANVLIFSRRSHADCARMPRRRAPGQGLILPSCPRMGKHNAALVGMRMRVGWSTGWR